MIKADEKDPWLRGTWQKGRFLVRGPGFENNHLNYYCHLVA